MRRDRDVLLAGRLGIVVVVEQDCVGVLVVDGVGVLNQDGGAEAVALGGKCLNAIHLI